ncbi:uncharacterized protein LOC123517615 [Portunus trituberculatus]|uniref:uncharacterized protein LOC123517615 n=1 Tax=Portunus trituberculatus TaxID=210409 RepID=UPI001E1CD575|nr:uncharacterized protein LOC123517615 [Portunus trituberculatus]
MILRPLPPSLRASLVLLMLALLGEACLRPRRHYKRMIFYRLPSAPRRQPQQDPAKINCLIDVCYLSLDHPKLCEDTLKALRDREAMEPCSDSCAANATGSVCLHPTVIMYLLDRYAGLSCGQQWESTFWGVDSSTTPPTTTQPASTSTWSPAPPRPPTQHPSHPDSSSLGVNKELRDSHNAPLGPAEHPRLYVSSKTRIVKYESRKKGARGSNLPDAVLWLLVHSKRLVFLPRANINNSHGPLKQPSLNSSDPSPLNPQSSFIPAQHSGPLIVAATFATRNPPASHHSQPAREGSQEAVTQHLTPTVLPDDAMEQQHKPQMDGEYKSERENTVDVRPPKATNTTVTPVRETTGGMKEAQRLSGNGQSVSLGFPSSSSDGISEPESAEGVAHTESRVRESSTRSGKEVLRKSHLSREGKQVSHHTNVLVRNLHADQEESSGRGLLGWVVVSLLSAVLMAVCCGLLTFACVTLCHARKRSYQLQ